MAVMHLLPKKVRARSKTTAKKASVCWLLAPVVYKSVVALVSIYRKTATIAVLVEHNVSRVRFVMRGNANCPVLLVKPTAMVSASMCKAIGPTVERVALLVSRVRSVPKGNVKSLA
jgi:hypothetical protein